MDDSSSQDLATENPTTENLATETPASNVFIPPSIHQSPLLAGESYTHHTPLPSTLSSDPSTPCVLGIDEAGRGPVLGPMVYGLFYLPLVAHTSLLKETHAFMDSKTLTPTVRSSLMRTLCTTTSDLHAQCGWATRVMSARDIGAGMLHPTGGYNLNAQAMDATISLIKEVFELGVNLQEIYIDTIGRPQTYQEKLQRIFPATKIVVAKKADSIYPCVSAASVVAKVTRDAALEVCFQAYEGEGKEVGQGWGSGYPSDQRTVGWLKDNVDGVFGWPGECRFSWGTAKDLLEKEGKKVEWPDQEEDESQGMKLTNYFVGAQDDGKDDELRSWFGRPATSVF